MRGPSSARHGALLAESYRCHCPFHYHHPHCYHSHSHSHSNYHYVPLSLPLPPPPPLSRAHSRTLCPVVLRPCLRTSDARVFCRVRCQLGKHRRRSQKHNMQMMTTQPIFKQTSYNIKQGRLSCDSHTHTLARQTSQTSSYTSLLYTCSTNCLGHGHGYGCHRPVTHM